jgi:hypothetical protein
MSDENLNKSDDQPDSPKTDYSTIFGVSVRGWIALILIISLCAMEMMKITVAEPLYSLSISICSFYFGHQIGRQNKS